MHVLEFNFNEFIDSETSVETPATGIQGVFILNPPKYFIPMLRNKFQGEYTTGKSRNIKLTTCGSLHLDK